MKRVLAVDTATWWGGVALIERQQRAGAPSVVCEIGVQVEDSHASRLLGWIERLLATAGWRRESLDGFVATHGPGSFTGIRVALGTVRGLSLATDRPCTGITTLDALAEAHGPAEAQRIPLIPAGRGEFYGARYDASACPPRPLEQPWLGSAERLTSPDDRQAVLIPPPGGESLVRRVASEAGLRLGRAPRSIAAAAGRLALMRGTLEAGDAPPLAPLYLRPPDAELHPRHR